MELRDYQIELLASIKKSLNINKYVLATAPTGAGKTIISFALIRDLIAEDKRVVFVVNREELVFQSMDKFSGLKDHISILKAGYDNMYDSNKKVQIIMLQTWHARKIEDLNPDVIIVDEVHEGWGAKRLTELLQIYPNAKILGLSATPINEKGYLIEGFDDYIQDIQVKELIDFGYLVRPRVLVPDDCDLDLSKVRITGNDYNTGDLDKVLVEIGKVQNIVKQYKTHANGLKTIVFANSIEHAEKLQQEFTNEGYTSEVLHSQIANLNEKRKFILSRFRSGKTQIIINVGILTTGFDEGSVECVLLARPTKILRLYIQIAGRGLRINPGKEECLYLDCANIVKTHGYPDDIRIFTQKPTNIEEFEIPYKQCPGCESMLNNFIQECPYCGFEFIGQEEPKLTKKEADGLVKLRNIQQECYERIQRLVERRNFKAGYSFLLLKDIAIIKPPTARAYVYYKKVLTHIKKVEAGYKLPWLIYSLRDHYKANDVELQTINGVRTYAA